jgi:hypothetical protein
MNSRSIYICILIVSLFAIKLSSGQATCVSVGSDVAAGTKNSIAYSLDGKTWFPVADRIFDNEGLDVMHSEQQSIWVAVGTATNSIAYSFNGINWFGLGMNIFTTLGKTVYYSASQNKWVAGGSGTNSIAYSLNGTAWTGIGASIFSTMYGVVYSPTVNRWVGVGLGSNFIAYSPDGISWTGLGAIIFGTQGTNVNFANGIFVATGASINSQAWSSDGITWTGTGQIFAGTCNDVSYGQGRWTIAGNPTISVSVFANSTDGASWAVQSQASCPLTSGYGVHYSPALNLWIGSGQGTSVSMVYSSNGYQWTAGTNSFSSGGWSSYCINTTLSQSQTQPVAITSDVTNLVTNTSIINVGYNIAINGNLTVLGDLYVLGNWTLNLINSYVNITGTLNLIGTTTLIVSNTSSLSASSINGGIVYSSTASISTSSQLMVTVSGSSLINSLFNSGGTATFLVASYSARSGVFSTVSAQDNPNDPAKCASATPTYGSSTLAVAVAVGPCQKDTNLAQSQTLSVGAIVGIVIGTVIGGALLATGIILLTIYLKNKTTEKDNNSIRAQEASQMRFTDPIGSHVNTGVTQPTRIEL